MRVLILLVLWLGLSPAVFAEKVIFGIVPQQSPLQLFKAWNPVASYLSAHSGSEVVFKTEKSIPEFEKVLYSGGYDLAYMNPYHYVVAHQKHHYEAAVRSSADIRGLLVANKDNADLEKLLQSPSTRFLFPAPNAFAATLLIKYELLAQYGISIDKQGHYQYVNSHDSVYAGIARGTGELGGGVPRTFKTFAKQQDKDKLQIVFETQAYPSHPLAFKPGLDPTIKKRLVEALLNLPKNLRTELGMETIIPAQDSDYERIRELAAQAELSIQHEP